jgi:hypothetical protein
MEADVVGLAEQTAAPLRGHQILALEKADPLCR